VESGRVTVKPFEVDKKFTKFSNDLIDYVMPTVSPNAWKILTVIWRQTEGWVVDKKTGDRKQWDEISYSQFMERTGIRSPAAVSRALKELMDLRYISRAQAERKDGSGKRQGYMYRLRDQIAVKSTQSGGG
jgi:hypothetical protein